MALARILTGKPAKSVLMVGLRGVGKTVLLDQVRLRTRIGPLNDAEAELAILKPAKDESVEYSSEAVAAILRRTKGYPYFLQEWGKHAWDRGEPKSHHVRGR